MSRHSRNRSPGANVRLLRVGENIRHVMAQLLSRDLVQDPQLTGASITVSEVEVSPDLRNATVFIVPLLGKDQDKVVAALNRAAPFLRGHLGAAVRLKYLPKLKFEVDRSFDEADRIEKLLADPRVRRDLQADADADADSEADDNAGSA